MNNLDLFRMGFKNLWRRKLRTFLTVLGVIIGASSIIVMLSLGFGMSQAFEDQIAQWGSLTTVNVHKSWEAPLPGKKEMALDDKAVKTFKSLDNVVAVSPTLQTYGSIINGRYVASGSIRGIDPDSMEDFGFEVAEGRLLNNRDSLTVVFGGQMQYNFYEPKARTYREPKINLMKDRMTLTLDPNYGWSGPGQNNANYKEYKIKVAGVLTEGNWETNYGIYMPLEDLQNLIKEKEKSENQKPEKGKKGKGYDQINVKVNDMKNVQEVQKTIKDMGYEAYSLNDELESMKKQAAVIQAVLGGIGAVSLLVAAIGITNTMVMSIYERTKEIGIMKVIGASLKDIKRLFLFESALIGLTGGIFGVGFSYLISLIINKFSATFGQAMGSGSTKISIIPIWLVLAAMVFSALIGIVSGYFPARRAMNLSALEAIKTE
ncbi:ABC transporter permease [Tissierella sp. MB52-C2]|uniref:ABC transporter permease n=1 Tax=Tissierella sp. MB52-C2 TaxID=3070999 RepID=UPI00280ADDBD|nr:ABC transporter permease [Tissierella sp. MB52-C2]WMM24269.1 ABC transporter permease [Tissierella sp. MB52-C2]